MYQKGKGFFMYIELTNLNEIKTAQKILFSQLEKELPYKRNRIIGYPSGYFEAEVRFVDDKGDDTSWWLGKKYKLNKDRTVYCNFFGHGNPETTDTLLIDLQFNFPYEKFTRSHGGVFIKDLQTGKVFLGHRGIVTRGKSRVRRDLLLQEADVTSKRISSSAKPGYVNVLMVTPIHKTGIIGDIRDFAAEIRRAASVVMESNQHSSTHLIRTRLGLSFFDEDLKHYFDEFMGTTTANRSGGQINMDCSHGIIVRALKNKFVKLGTPYKSQTIDLVIETKDKILLFEIKTSFYSQSIYTGIGQLCVHSAVLSRRFPDREVVRYLVMPIDTKDDVQHKILQELGINLMPYKMVNQRVFFKT
jgi:hypothetical protein